MSLCLHTGAQPVGYDALRALKLPDATDTHVPIPHHSVVDMVKYSLGFFGHEVVGEDYGVTPDGARFFGVLSLRSEYGDYCDQVGLRNSHDKRFPIGVSFGSRVFVCDNLAFNADTVLKRKHTLGAKKDLPGLVAQVVEPLRDQRMRQAAMFEGYRQKAMAEYEVDQAIMQLYRRGVINITRIADVLSAYETPPHDWGPATAWRLFNATTFALAGRVAENPHATTLLHDVIDSFCPEPDHNQLRLPSPVH